MVPLFTPEVVPLRLSHAPPVVTALDQLSVPPPELLTVTAWLEGLLPPCVAVKFRKLVVNPIEGSGGATANVTETVTVEGLALGIDIDNCPL
jgi:hypothetical protein